MTQTRRKIGDENLMDLQIIWTIVTFIGMRDLLLNPKRLMRSGGHRPPLQSELADELGVAAAVGLDVLRGDGRF